LPSAVWYGFTGRAAYQSRRLAFSHALHSLRVPLYAVAGFVLLQVRQFFCTSSFIAFLHQST
jgi:hypothetical protein